MFINFNQLRSFYYAAKLNSISQAAKELMVTPAAVSMQIKLFEAEWGFNLMYREGRYIRLTEQGKGVFDKAESVFKKMYALSDYLDEVTKNRSGELRIGCHEVPAKYIMPELIEQFNMLHPNIKVILELGKTSVMLTRIRNHEIPLALVVRKGSDSRIIVKPIVKNEIYLVAAKQSKLVQENSISIERLASIPLATQERDSGMVERINDYLEGFGISPNVVMETGSLDMMKDFVARDKALAFVEAFAIQDRLKNNQLKKIKIREGSLYVEMGICYLKTRKLSPVTQAFLNMLDDFSSSLG